MYVQFTDETKTKICSIFDCPQDPEVWPNQGEVDESDSRYQAFLNPVVVPYSITQRQARLAMLNAGIYQQVQSAIAAMPGTDGEAARITWEFASSIDRDFPLVAQLSASLGLTSEQVDQLFIDAAKL